MDAGNTMSLKLFQIAFVATVLLTAFTIGATASTANAGATAQSMNDDAIQSIDKKITNHEICDSSGLSIMCGGAGKWCPDPDRVAC